jgi:serine/threonine protein kinase
MFRIPLICPACQVMFQAPSRARPQPVCCPSCRAPLSVPALEIENPLWCYLHPKHGEQGPLTLTQLRRRAERGEVTPQTVVWWLGAATRLTASAIEGLIPQLPSEDIFDDQTAQIDGSAPAAPSDGPLSQRGVSARPHRTLTWGDFQVLKKVGAGNMGAVYLAHHKSTQRQVALKVLYQNLATRAEFVERFYREAQAMTRLDHPSIVRCFGVGEEKGCPYFAMEYVRGFNTAVILRELGRPFAVGDALYIVLRCLEAMQHAHERHVIHRDLKPENILITDLGRVKITDLGLAKPMDQDTSLTDTGVGMGTPKYVAPEQANDAKRADQRADIYALGGILYHYLTGQPPFQGRNALELLVAKETGKFPEARRVNPDVPAHLSLIVDRMLAADPRQRYADCADVIRALGELGLAHEHLGFNVLHVCHVLEPEAVAGRDQVEVLLIHDDPSVAHLAQEALDQSGIFSNLNVVESGDEALRFLKRLDRYVTAPRPNLILLGLDVHRPDSLALLTEMQAREWLRSVPLVVLEGTPDTAAYLRELGLKVDLVLSSGEDIPAFERLIKSVSETCVTVVEWPRQGP